MQVKEILRVKGNRLLSIEPAGRAADAVRPWRRRTSARWWCSSRAAWSAC